MNEIEVEFEDSGVYSITNLINGKIYIGQSVCISKRWQEHLYSMNNVITPLYIDMKEYGVENFKFEVIENLPPIDSILLNAEKKWIQKFKANNYNFGYNFILDNIAQSHKDYIASLNLSIVYGIIHDLQNTDLTFEDIAIKYKVYPSIISAINFNKYKIFNEYQYPLRAGYTEQRKNNIEAFKQDLKNNDTETITVIAKRYNLRLSTALEINNGHIHVTDDYDYPIRPARLDALDFETMDGIVNDLLENKLKLAHIAKKYGVSKTRIFRILNGMTVTLKDGSIYKYPEGITFPMRTGYLGRMSPETADAIKEDLRNTNLTIKQLCEKYNTRKPYIHRINIGARYHKEGEKYPCRPYTARDRLAAFSDEEMYKLEIIIKESAQTLTEIGNKYKMNRHVIMNINNNVFDRQTKKFIKRDKPLRDIKNPPSLLDENGYKRLYILISPNKDLEYEKLFSSQA